QRQCAGTQGNRGVDHDGAGRAAPPDRGRARHPRRTAAKGGATPACLSRAATSRYSSAFGRNSTVSGNTQISARQAAKASMKYATPAKMVWIGTSGDRPLTMKTFTPAGGVTAPIVVTMVSTIVNQIGS